MTAFLKLEGVSSCCTSQQPPIKFCFKICSDIFVHHPATGFEMTVTQSPLQRKGHFSQIGEFFNPGYKAKNPTPHLKIKFFKELYFFAEMQSHALAQGFHAQHLAQKFVIHIAFWHIAFWIIKMEFSNRPFDLENTIVQTPHNVTFR